MSRSCRAKRIISRTSRPDAVAAVVPGKKAAQAVDGHVGGDRLGVGAVPGGLDGVLVQVGGENLHLRRVVEGAGVLAEQHGDGIRLLARGAGGDPDADGVRRPLALEKRREGGLQGGEGFAVAEEVGDADEQVLQERAGPPGWVRRKPR